MKVIGVYTKDFSLYYDVLKTLRNRKIPYVSLSSFDDIPKKIGVIITSNNELHDVKVSNAIVKIEETEKNVQIIGPGDYSDSFSIKKQVARVIRPGQEYSIELPLSKLQHHQFGKMDIAIKVSFKWLFMQKESIHRFETIRGDDGQWHWQPQPTEKE